MRVRGITWRGSPARRLGGSTKALVDGKCPYSVLGLQQGAPRREIRAAYVEKMKEVHPDVSDEDTTSIASLVNLAYETLCKELSQSSTASTADDGWLTKDAFDMPLGEACLLFVNPFRCGNVDPLQWRALQSLAQSGSDPEAALSENGISFSESAICYVTYEQMEILESEMESMCATLDFGFCEWSLSDYLLRARQTNKAVSQS